MSDFDEFGELGEEELLRKAFERVDAPAGLKRKILTERNLRAQRGGEGVNWHLLQRLAATILLTTGLSGTLMWHHYQVEQQAKVRQQQLMLALRITNHALEHVRERLADKGRLHE